MRRQKLSCNADPTCDQCGRRVDDLKVFLLSRRTKAGGWVDFCSPDCRVVFYKGRRYRRIAREHRERNEARTMRMSEKCL